MTGDGLRKVLEAEPFRPFRLCLAGGRLVDVAYPEFVAVSPGGRTVAAFEPGSDGATIIDLLLVESIEEMPSNSNGANGSSGQR